MPPQKKQDQTLVSARAAKSDALKCSCGKGFSNVSALTAHCDAKDHSLMLVAQFHQGKTLVNNYVFHNTPVEISAAENGFTIQPAASGGTAQAKEGVSSSSSTAVNDPMSTDDVPEVVTPGAMQLLAVDTESSIKNENQEPPQPNLPVESAQRTAQATRAKQTKAWGTKGCSCPVCDRSFIWTQGCYSHCLAKHKCCPRSPIWDSLKKFEEHLIERHGHNEALQVNQVALDTRHHTRAKTRSQTKAAFRQEAAHHSLPPKPPPQEMPSPSTPAAHHSLPPKPVPRVRLPPLRPSAPTNNPLPYEREPEILRGDTAAVSTPALTAMQPVVKESKVDVPRSSTQSEMRRTQPSTSASGLLVDAASNSLNVPQGVMQDAAAVLPSSTNASATSVPNLIPSREYYVARAAAPAAKKKSKGGSGSAGDPAQLTARSAHVSVAAVWGDLDLSKLRSKTSVINDEDGEDGWS